MKNFEKYEKEIKENLNNANSYAFMSKLSGKFINYMSDAIEWLYEDYKEPLLTDKEKEYLKAVIEPFKDKIAYIVKGQVILSIKIWKDNQEGLYITLPLDFTYQFKEIEGYKQYTLEELGLC